MNIPWKRLAGIVVTFLFLYLIFNNLDIKQTLEAFKGLDPIILALIVPVYLLVFVLRAFRWKVILPEVNCCKFSTLMEYLFIGYTLNCFLPARAGDFYRSHLIGEKCCVKKVKAFAGIFIERIFDGSIVFLILLYSIISFFKEPWVYKLAIFVGCFFWGGFLLLMLLAKKGHPEKFFLRVNSFLKEKQFPFKEQTKIILSFLDKHLKSFIEGLDIFHSNKALFKIAFLTSGIWFLESFIIFIVAHSFGHPINLLSAMFTESLAVFGAMIPVATTFLGPYQYAFIVGLGTFNLTKEIALAISVACQTCLISTVTICGTISLLKNQINLSSIKQKISSNDEELISAK